uniref:maleylpyruvate isomerase family mycothiol-dependent enzyme n=1 Tax=Pseudomonas aeruginosa TaxID=287 RepID=UPI0013A5BCD8
MTKPDPLALWDAAAQDLLPVLRELTDDDWQRPALPGWTVQDVLAHLAHLESEAAQMTQPPGGRIDIEVAGSRPMTSDITQAGVV